MKFGKQATDRSESSACHVGCTGESSLRLRLPQLMRNVGLASEICKGLSQWRESRPKNERLTHPLPHLYYLMRQLVLAYHYPELRRPLCTTLKGLSHGSLDTYGWLVAYICCRSPIKAIWAHKIRDLEAEREPGDDIDTKPRPPYKNSWVFAFDVYWKLEFDRDDGIDGEADDEYHPFGGRIADH